MLSRVAPERGLRTRPLTLVVLLLLASLSALGFASIEGQASSDQDGDGLSYGLEYLMGTQAQDPDTDGDGLPDGWEYFYGLNPLSSVGANGSLGDVDNDGLTNLQEYSYGIPTNWDNAGTSSVLDNGVWWNGTVPIRQWNESNGFAYPRPAWGSGTDSDPMGDICNDAIDNDADGVLDSADSDDDGDANCGSDDDDGDGVADNDPDGWDTDNDGMDDGWEVANGLDPTSRSNADGAIGDPDGDNLSNIYEYANPSWDTQCTGGVDCWAPGPDAFTITETRECNPVTGVGGPNCGVTITAEVDGITQTDPQDGDTDGDGLGDGREALLLLTDPTTNDTDGDGIEDGVEVNSSYGGNRSSDPLSNNTDGDVFDDGEEDVNGNGLMDGNETDPTRREDEGDFDGDGIENWMENLTCTQWNLADSDGGGVDDLDEQNHTTDPCDSLAPFETTVSSYSGGAQLLTVADGTGFNPAGGQGFYNGTGGFTAFTWTSVTGNALSGVSVTPPEGNGMNVGTHDGSWCYYEATQAGTRGTTQSYCDDDFRDSDGDGIADWQETEGTFGYVTNPNLRDTDGDGVEDDEEVFGDLGRVTDPNEACDNALDSDGDGANNWFENTTGCPNIYIGVTNGSNDAWVTAWNDSDTDNGGVGDGTEYFDGTNPEYDPTDDQNPVDTDGDGIPDAMENITGTDWQDPDTDGGGVSDGEECPIIEWPTCSLIDTNPFDPSDDISSTDVVFWANVTSGTVDTALDHRWRVRTLVDYTGAAYAINESEYPASTIAAGNTNSTWLPANAYQNSTVTWDLEYRVGLQPGTDMPVPSNVLRMTSWTDAGATINRSIWTHRMETDAAVIDTLRATQPEVYYDPTTVLPDTQAFSGSSHATEIPSTFNDSSERASAVRNITNAITANASGAWEVADAIEDFLLNGNGTTNFSRYFDDQTLPFGRDFTEWFLTTAQRGTCSEFVTVFVTMARMAGLPARKAFGYSSGTWTGSGYQVIGLNSLYWGEVHLESDQPGNADLGWIPFDPCPAAAPIEVVNATINTRDFDRNGSTPVSLTGQLRFEGNTTPVSNLAVNLYLAPDELATQIPGLGMAAERRINVGTVTTDAEGNFSFSGWPAMMIDAPGDFEFVVVNGREGYASRQGHQLGFTVNVSDSVEFAHMTPNEVDFPRAGAGSSTEITGTMLWATPSQNTDVGAYNMTIFLNFTSSVLGAQSFNTVVGPDGIWSITVDIDANESSGALATTLVFPGWHETGLNESITPEYHVLPLNWTLNLNISQAPNLTATLEGPLTNNSILQVGQLVYVNATAVTSGVSPSPMSGTLYLQMRENGSGSYADIINFVVPANGTLQTSFNLTALLANVPAGRVDIVLLFDPDGLDTTDTADLPEDYFLQGTVAIALSAAPQLRGQQVSVQVSLTDHRGQSTLQFDGQFDEYFDSGYLGNVTDPTEQFEILWTPAETTTPGDYLVFVDYNETSLYQASNGSVMLRLQGNVSLNHTLSQDWTHLGGILTITGNVTDDVLGGHVTGNDTVITVEIQLPGVGFVPVGTGALDPVTGNFSVNATMPSDRPSGVYAIRITHSFTAAAGAGGPYYSPDEQVVINIGIQSEFVITADVTTRIIEAGAAADFNLTVTDVTNGITLVAQDVELFWDANGTNVSMGTAGSNITGIAQLNHIVPADTDPGWYEIRAWAAANQSSNVGDVNPLVGRWLGNGTWFNVTVQVVSSVNITSLDASVVSGQSFNVMGQIEDGVNATRNLTGPVDLEFFFLDETGEILATGVTTAADGSFNTTLSSDPQADGLQRGNHTLVVTVLNGTSPFYLGSTGSQDILVVGVSNLESLLPATNQVVLRGDNVSVGGVLVEQSFANAPINGATIDVLFDETWVPATATTIGDGSFQLTYAVPPTQPLGPVPVTFFFNGTFDLLATNGTLNRISIQATTVLVIEAIAANPVAGETFTVNGSLLSDNGSATMTRAGVFLQPQLQFTVDGGSVGFLIVGGQVDAGGVNWTANITLLDSFPAGNHTVAVTYTPQVNYYLGAADSGQFDSRGFSVMQIQMPGDLELADRTLRGDPINLTLQILDNTGANVVGAQVNVTINGTNVTASATTLIDGLASMGIVTPADLEAGIATLYAWWNGSGGTTGLVGSTASTRVVVLADTNISNVNFAGASIAGQVIWINGTLLDDLGLPLLDGGVAAPAVVHLYLDGVWVASNESEALTGAFSLSYRLPTTTGSGPHTVRVSFLGGPQWGNPGVGNVTNPEFYLPTQSELQIIVRVPTEVILFDTGSEIDREQNMQLNGTLLDIAGNSLANRTVEVWFRGVFLTNVTTDHAGRFTVFNPVAANQPLGPNEMLVRFNRSFSDGTADDLYLASQANTTWFVYSPVNIDLILPTQAVTGENITVRGDVRDNRITGFLADHTLEVRFDGALVGTVVSDANGNWNLTWTLADDLALGPHVVTVTAQSIGYYRTGEATGEVIVAHHAEVSLIVEDPDKARGEAWNVSGRLVDADDPLRVGLEGRFVELWLDDMLLQTVFTGVNGTWSTQITVPFNVSRGGHVLMANFSGESLYLGDNATAPVTAWADLAIEMLNASDTVVRGFPENPISLRGRLVEIGGDELFITEQSLSMTADELPLAPTLIWTNTSFSLEAIAPSELTNATIAVRLSFAGNASEFLRPTTYATSMTLQLRIDFEVIVDEVVLGDADESNDHIRGRVILTANDTGLPVGGIQVVVILTNESDNEFDRLRVERSGTTNDNGSYSFVFEQDPPYGDRSVYGVVILRIDSTDTRIDGLSNILAGAAGAGDVVSVEEIPPPPWWEAWIGPAAVGLVIAAIAGVVMWRRRKQEADALTKMQEIFSYTAELLAAGDEVREAIYNCYESLCGVLMRHRFLRRDFETVREFENAIRQALPIREDALVALDQMFEEARYSKHELSTAHQEQAQHALGQVLQELENMSEPIPAR